MSNRRRQRELNDAFDLTLAGHKPVHYRPHQKPYADAIKSSKITVGIGPAGTGKTFVAASIAAERLATGVIQKVYLTRPTIPVDGEEIGFLPGKLEAKMAPWTAPILDVFHKRIGAQKTQQLVIEQKIEIVPFAFMRGRTFSDAMLLVDEAQNMTVRQAKLLMTRPGENCITVIDGDLDQSDLEEENGLEWICDMIERYDLPYPLIEFDESQVVRSKEARVWVEVIAKEEDRL